jgi:hypothetical protein
MVFFDKKQKVKIYFQVTAVLTANSGRCRLRGGSWPGAGPKGSGGRDLFFRGQSQIWSFRLVAARPWWPSRSETEMEARIMRSRKDGTEFVCVTYSPALCDWGAALAYARRALGGGIGHLPIIAVCEGGRTAAELEREAAADLDRGGLPSGKEG